MSTMKRITATMNRHPNKMECLDMLTEYGTPAHVTAHCKAVAAVACRLGDAMNKVGGTRAPSFVDVRFEEYIPKDGRIRYRIDSKRTVMDGSGFRSFDMDLVMAAGLLHDMARVKERHWDVCADICNDKGFYEESRIIRIHMQYEFTADAFHLTEADLVGLGDRLTLEDSYVGIDRRMEYIIDKAERNGNFEARPVILRKKEETKKLLNEIESRIGTGIDELMTDIEYD